jgi:hypothetical protein
LACEFLVVLLLFTYLIFIIKYKECQKPNQAATLDGAHGGGTAGKEMQQTEHATWLFSVVFAYFLNRYAKKCKNNGVC